MTGLLLALISLQASLVAQSPIRKTLAYSRETISGTPSASPFLPSYLIYVLVDRGTEIALNGVCVRGNKHGGELRRVDSPVIISHDPNVRTAQADTLVPKTAQDVYQVEIGDSSGPCSIGQAQGDLGQHNEVVLCLKSGGSNWYGLVPKIVQLPPAAAM